MKRNVDNRPCVLLIDDDVEFLRALEKDVKTALTSGGIDTVTWSPSSNDSEPMEELRARVSENTVLVATDVELTRRGIRGLFGHTIVEWCHGDLVPVGSYSRAQSIKLPDRPDLFELRFAKGDAPAIVNAAYGFRDLSSLVSSRVVVDRSDSNLSTVLAAILDGGECQQEFAAYLSHMTIDNSILLQHLIDLRSRSRFGDDEIRRVLTYLVGHVLCNSILMFPGPLLSMAALCAYIACSESEADALSGMFSSALYDGPFGKGRLIYWRNRVDDILDAADFDADEFESFAEYNRSVVESKLGRKLKRHDCARCDGDEGGFLCPFTDRVVCRREDCSLTSCNWIPQGAQFCRVERDFYDECSPILGL